MTLSAEEFLRRFVQHVLPRGFVKIRHYGLLASRGRNQRLARCRRLLLPATVACQLAVGSDTANQTGPARQPCCPHCGGTRLRFEEFSAQQAVRLGVVALNTS